MLWKRILGIWIMTVGITGGYLFAQMAGDSTEPLILQAYSLGVGDVVTISVWKNENLGAVVPVRPDGRITVPLVGEIEVAGKRPLEVQELLTSRYKDFVTAPAVSVVINQINSWKVYVLGEVREPGTYDILRPTRLLQALAMAGGFTEFAKKDEIVVLRETATGEQRQVCSVKAITAGKQMEDNIPLRPGDTIVVP